jgi:ubiquitin carboxyl-terminal hydrolase 22/27/51
LAAVQSRAILNTTVTGLIILTEHLQRFHEQGDKAWKTFLQEYVKTLKVIENQHPIVPQTFKDSEPRKNSPAGSQPVNTTIRPTLMCIQCPFINSARTGVDHWEKKDHCFCEWGGLLSRP